MNRRYRPKSAAVVHETFDDEVVIVNLDSGDYFSLSGVGALCWVSLVEGKPIGSVIEAVLASYDATREVATAALGELVDSLLEQGLLVPSEDGPPAPGPSEAPPAAASRMPFEPPILSQYSDMRDLLLIDPIHEVDETGWPEVKKESENSEEN